jgi:replication factor C subunit 2/4
MSDNSFLMGSKGRRHNRIKATSYDEDNEKLQESLPWVEKYRPKTIDSLSLDKNIKAQLKQMILDKDVRNIILEGPSGVGKTSTVRCIAREIYKKYYGNKVLEINASDDRGIKIQNPIDIFNRVYVHIDAEDVGQVPDFKLVILDEADNMTDKAKHNIAKFIETNNSGVRFAFTCNSKINISTAIQSRCHIINYPKLKLNFVTQRLKEICYAEDIYNDLTDKKIIKKLDRGIFAISEIADGDLRIAVNTLQLTYDIYGEIDMDKVYETYDKPHPEQSRDIITACIKLDISKANGLMMMMIKKGFSVIDITSGLTTSLRQSICSDIPDLIKIMLIQKISYSQYNVSHGLDLSYIQARGCVADMCDAILVLESTDYESIISIRSVLDNYRFNSDENKMMKNR